MARRFWSGGFGNGSSVAVANRQTTEAVAAPAPATTPAPTTLQVSPLVAEQIAKIIQGELDHERIVQNDPRLDPTGLCDAQKLRLAGKIARVLGS